MRAAPSGSLLTIARGCDDLLGRATDGLRVHTFSGAASGWTANPPPTLTALAGPASTSAGIYAPIQTANLDGRGGRDVLALDGTALQAWSYDPQGKAWTRLSPSTPLALGADPWLEDPRPSRRSRPVTSTATAATT